MENLKPNIIYVRKKNHAYLHVDAEPSICNELVDFFQFFVPGYKFMPSYRNKFWDGKVRLYDSRSKELYSGLYQYLQEFAAAEGREYKIELEHDAFYGYPLMDHKVDLGFINELVLTSKGKAIAPRDYQLEAVEHGLTRRQAMLISPTASGKSMIIYLLLRYYLMHNTKRKVLIIVPTTSLVQQMYTDFKDYSEFDDTFDGDELCHMIYAGKEKIDIKKRVIVSTWQSIYKMPSSWFEQFGAVFGDEAHNFKAKSLTSILTKLKDAEFRFGTTGTLDGTQTHKLVLEGLFGPCYYVTTTKELMDSGSLAQLSINILLLKYPESVCQQLKKAKYPDEVDFIVRYEQRNKFISNLTLDQDGNTLVLFQYVEKHGKVLHSMIASKAHERRKVFFVSGATDVDDREQIRSIVENEKNAIIVASMGTFSTGINIRNIHNIVFASPSKSQIRVLQSIGRGLRKSDDGRDTILYDIADDLHYKGHKNYTLQHSAERIKIYTREKFTYKIFEVPLI
jgi:superfamily II DNA or RNA helicase